MWIATQFRSRLALKSFGSRGAKTGVSVFMGGAQKAVQLIVHLVAIRYAYKSLGAEAFGLWSALTATTFLFSFADFGVANSILNPLTKAFAVDNFPAARRLLTNAQAVVLVLAALLAIGVYLLPATTLTSWLGVSSALLKSETPGAAYLACAALVVTIATSLAQKVNAARLESYETSCWQLGGSLFSVLAVWAVTRQATNVRLFVLAFLSGSVAASLLNFGHVFLIKSGRSLFDPMSLSRKAAASIAFMGLPFLLQQISAAILVQAPTIIIAATIGAQSVGFYSVAARLATIAPIVVSLVAIPLWPAYAHAIAKKDFTWVSRTNLRVASACAVFALAYGCALLLGSKFVLGHLLGKDIETARALLPLVLVGSMATCLRWPSSMLLCAGGYIRGITIAQCATAAIATIIALYYGHQHNLRAVVLSFVIAEWSLVTAQYILTYHILHSFSQMSVSAEQAVSVT